MLSHPLEVTKHIKIYNLNHLPCYILIELVCCKESSRDSVSSSEISAPFELYAALLPLVTLPDGRPDAGALRCPQPSRPIDISADAFGKIRACDQERARGPREIPSSGSLADQSLEHVGDEDMIHMGNAQWAKCYTSKRL